MQGGFHFGAAKVKFLKNLRGMFPEERRWQVLGPWTWRKNILEDGEKGREQRGNASKRFPCLFRYDFRQ